MENIKELNMCIFITHKHGGFWGKNAILCPRFLLNCYTEMQWMFLVTNVFKIHFSWYIPLVKNKNTMFILADLASNNLILMSCSQCKHKVERSSVPRPYLLRVCSSCACARPLLLPEGRGSIACILHWQNMFITCSQSVKSVIGPLTCRGVAIFGRLWFCEFCPDFTVLDSRRL